MLIRDLEVHADAAVVADAVAARLLQARRDWPELPLGLATGRTMEPVYRALVALVSSLPLQQREALIRNWQSFNLDEYWRLGPSEPRSFAAVMQQHLGRSLGLGPDQLHLPDGLASDPDAEARRYGDAVKAGGGIGLQLLGLGLNGHVGFNEPPCGPEAPCRRVTLSLATRAQNAEAFGGDPTAVPQQAITLGMDVILAARQVVLVVTGASKAQILKRLLQDLPSPELPASWLQRHPRVSLIVDQAAMGLEA